MSIAATNTVVKEASNNTRVKQGYRMAGSSVWGYIPTRMIGVADAAISRSQGADGCLLFSQEAGTVLGAGAGPARPTDG
jgi:hypothetical protein